MLALPTVDLIDGTEEIDRLDEDAEFLADLRATASATGSKEATLPPGNP
ncbi:hypothetical protein [Aurantimonas sp. HBX-1]|nr:hypothetical protein [Aurantimonas sp. HBX-1]UIJ70594.1 hypothetical protein LXB15_12600 [Aurantimonas sp. HBX-1]